MSSQELQLLMGLLGEARAEPYMAAANGDPDRARELYLWATELAGSLHAQISFVEIAVRNAMDAQLSLWNSTQGEEYGCDWALDRGAASPLYEILSKELRTAQSWAQKEPERRPRDHPRYGAGVTHDDVVAQLMFGAWVKLIRPASSSESSDRQCRLWDEALHLSFPYADSTNEYRLRIGHQLEVVRKLRNRVAHHDNLLAVEVNRRLNGMLSLLAKIDPSYPEIAMARSQLRRLAKEDPRRRW